MSDILTRSMEAKDEFERRHPYDAARIYLGPDEYMELDQYANSLTYDTPPIFGIKTFLGMMVCRMETPGIKIEGNVIPNAIMDRLRHESKREERIKELEAEIERLKGQK